MKAMNNRKRVSFGSKGSMVETWIIEDMQPPRTYTQEDFITTFVARSKSGPGLESRDNPFLPGGDLSKEAEDLLSKATIVRDKFYLEQQNQGHAPPSDHHPAPPHSTQPSHHDSVDGTLPNDKTHPGAVEERIAPTSASRAEARPEPPHPRENGKASDGVTSPDGVKVEVGATPTADGGKGGGSDNAGDQQQEKDKAKRRPKCCVVM